MPTNTSESCKQVGGICGHAGLKPATDWRDRFSTEAASRGDAVMQRMHAILAQPGNEGVCSLGPGAPSADFFPFFAAEYTVPSAGFPDDAPARCTTQLHIGMKDVSEGVSNYDLSSALQYGVGTGSKQLLGFVKEHVKIFHNPPYLDWDCILTTGNTSAMDTVMRIFGQKGVTMVIENHTYPTCFETGLPLGYSFFPAKMDNEGLLPDELDRDLSSWDEEARGMKRPTMLYTIPTGQNPSGATPSADRRRQVYAVAQKHDLYILEDDPYYVFQFEQEAGPPGAAPPTTQQYARSLIPSYLSMDTDGRVFRMDSFAKTISPGARVGWVTAARQVVERVMRVHEVSTQHPSGISQIALYRLLHDEWGHDGWTRWMLHICEGYKKRRDVMVGACEASLPRDVVSWNAPAAGFFMWLTIDWHKHPQAGTMSTHEIEQVIYDAAIRHQVLVVPGSWFLVDQGKSGMDTVFFRMTFAAPATNAIPNAVKALGDAIREVFKMG
ncbi:hypothetical protein PG999_012742 [Apiospora kogelbergensis]|uniref:Aminotransferase class I/classII large domain-containing protein n=1 Tax=Apiospora kogelbergensis TaxID=1337665 RepID=A0AAW0QDG1_9PEZI